MSVISQLNMNYKIQKHLSHQIDLKLKMITHFLCKLWYILSL